MMLRSTVLLVLLGAIYGIQTRIDAAFGEYRAAEDILYVDSGATMKRVLLGYDNVAADLYWLRTVQYFGGKRLDATNKDYRLLEPLLNLTIELDPEFKIAYSYGATFLSEPFPTGAGLPSKGIEIIERGIANHPEHWRFYLDKAFIHFWFLNDPKTAAEVVLEGSELPGAPYWMVTTAGRMMADGGDRDTARHLWELVYQSAETPQQRDNAGIHLRQLDALDEIDLLNEIVERFHESTGRYPVDWGELVDARMLTKVPVDPSGAAYVLNPYTHVVEPGPDSTLGNLPLK